MSDIYIREAGEVGGGVYGVEEHRDEEDEVEGGKVEEKH